MIVRFRYSRVCPVLHMEIFEKRNARAGPPLPEALRLLSPLAPNLEKLGLGDNNLGGTITADIAAFTKLTELMLFKMGLGGSCL